jgi:hypothetical protein
MAVRFELTILQKANGETLSKQIELDAAGKIHNDSSACALSCGSAERFGFETAAELAAAIATCPTHQAFALGRLRDGIPDKVDVVTKRDLNGAAPGTIARTLDYFEFLPGVPAWVMLDFDRKGMPTTVSNRITQLGGLEAALLSVLPELDKTMRVYRRSTSAELRRVDTGERFDGIGGVHVYVAVCDGSDIPRFLKTLHERCWLTGLGWGILDVAGRFLERALIDRAVGSPERLQFEGQARLNWPLEQDAASRQPWVHDGGLLDTKRACPPLDYTDVAKLNDLRATEKMRLRPESERVRKSYITQRAEELVTIYGMSKNEAIKVLMRQCDGLLLPDLVLPFDDPELAGCTVADVLADPERFHEATLADPIEGITYGRDKAKIFVNIDGSIVIHSFAHGRVIYRLCWDYRHALAITQEGDVSEVTQKYIECILNGDLDPVEAEQLRNAINKKHRIGKKALKDALKAVQERAAENAAIPAQGEQLVIAAAGRPLFTEPHPKDEWEPVVQQINEVLVSATRRLPAARDVEHHILIAQTRELPRLHILTSKDVNIPAAKELAEGEDDGSTTKEK